MGSTDHQIPTVSEQAIENQAISMSFRARRRRYKITLTIALAQISEKSKKGDSVLLMPRAKIEGVEGLACGQEAPAPGNAQQAWQPL